jgi:hypothetical protein
LLAYAAAHSHINLFDVDILIGLRIERMGFCENSTSEQFQNSRFEPVDMNRSPACDFRISEAVNKRLKQISAESGEKVDSKSFFSSFFSFLFVFLGYIIQLFVGFIMHGISRKSLECKDSTNKNMKT